MTPSHQSPPKTDEAAVEKFEAAVVAQQAVPRERYDDAYYQSNWRRDHSAYDQESRRRVEDRHPRLIKATFQPARVLDVGCGPGFLMLFLLELGVDVHGIDFSEAAIEIAPSAVRGRIIHGDITEPHVPPRSFDLVICREVLEHLSVVQIRHAVAQLCWASSRFVYITTRFHPRPTGLLDFTSDPDLDPTHITLLNKGLLRCLLVLEGFARRPDLESALDWARKGRVLVYERRVP